MAAASKDQNQADQGSDQQDSKPALKRYKVTATRLPLVQDGIQQMIGYGKTVELDPNDPNTQRFLAARGIIAVDDEEAQQDEQPRGSLDATPPGPPAGSVGTPVEANDQGAALS